MSTEYHIVIPARMASERLPGKPLADVNGKPLLEHVYRRANDSGAHSVVIATDDEQIYRVAESFGAEVMMTSPAHASGTDRIAECARRLEWNTDTLVVNLQGDEPQMPPRCLDQVAELLAVDHRADMASLYWPIDSVKEIEDPNVVKVITAEDGAALAFSRSVLPYPRSWGSVEQAVEKGVTWKRHIGLYAYRVRTLMNFSETEPGELEKAERLEQLRLLARGGRIAMAKAAAFIPAGVDTPADLERVRKEVI